MSLNMLSRFVTAILQRGKSLNFVSVVTICIDFGAQEKKVCHCFPISYTFNYTYMYPEMVKYYFLVTKSCHVRLSLLGLQNHCRW